MTTTSPLYTTTFETGGCTKVTPAVYAHPDRTRLATDSQGFAGGSVNGPFVADFLSAALTHEQCGRHLYRSVAGRTANPMLQSRYAHYGNETEEHIAILRDLVTALGGEPAYVSPAARATEKLDHGALEATFLLDGSLDLMTKEMAMLDAVVVAETIDRANWLAIEALGEALPEGPARDAVQVAVGKVRPQEDDHLQWALEMRAKLTHLQATRPLVTSLAETAEHAVDWFKGLLRDDPDPA
jgi:hypothetical protein